MIWLRHRVACWRSRHPKGCPEDRLLSSVQMTLMMGPMIAVPVPSTVLQSLSEVEVDIHDIEPSGFKLTFSIDKQSPLQLLFLLTGGMPLLFMRCIVVATVN